MRQDPNIVIVQQSAMTVVLTEDLLDHIILTIESNYIYLSREEVVLAIKLLTMLNGWTSTSLGALVMVREEKFTDDVINILQLIIKYLDNRPATKED